MLFSFFRHGASNLKLGLCYFSVRFPLYSIIIQAIANCIFGIRSIECNIRPILWTQQSSVESLSKWKLLKVFSFPIQYNFPDISNLLWSFETKLSSEWKRVQEKLARTWQHWKCALSAEKIRKNKLIILFTFAHCSICYLFYVHFRLTFTALLFSVEFTSVFIFLCWWSVETSSLHCKKRFDYS